MIRIGLLVLVGIFLLLAQAWALPDRTELVAAGQDSNTAALMDLTWGDNDCSGEVLPADALPPLYYLAEMELAQSAGPNDCPAMGYQFPTTDKFWGDVSCINFSVELFDVVSILKYVAGVAYQRTPSCPDIGTAYSPPN